MLACLLTWPLCWGFLECAISSPLSRSAFFSPACTLAPREYFFLFRTEGCDLEHATLLCSDALFSIATSARSSVGTSGSHFSPQEAVIKPVFSEAPAGTVEQQRRYAEEVALICFCAAAITSWQRALSLPTPPFFSRMLPAPLMTYQYQRSFIKAASECRLLCFSFAPRFYRWCFYWQI